MLRMALWIPVFAALFGPVSNRAAGVHTVYYTFLRVPSRWMEWDRMMFPIVNA